MTDAADDSVYDDAEQPTDDAAETKPLFVDVGPEEDDGTPERKPQKVEPRQSVAGIINLAWAGVGTALVQTGTDPGVGRVMMLQAPVAAQKIDQMVKGTIVDTFLQPFARQVDQVEGLGTVLLFPILVGIYERNEALGTMIEPVLRQVIHASLLDLAPVMRKQTADIKRAAKSVGDLNELLGIDPTLDPTDAILGYVLYGPAGAPPEPTEE